MNMPSNPVITLAMVLLLAGCIGTTKEVGMRVDQQEGIDLSSASGIGQGTGDINISNEFATKPLRVEEMAPFEFTGNISIDGDGSDWEGIPETFDARSGDSFVVSDLSNGTQTIGKVYQYDISGVRLFRGEQGLFTMMELVEDIDDINELNRVEGQDSVRIAVLNLDIDQDRDTGDEGWPCQVRGYDREIHISVNMTGHVSYTMWVSYREVSPTGDGFREWVVPYVRDSVDDPDIVAYEGNIIEFLIPENIVGFKRGQAVRMVFYEAATSGPADCSNEVVGVLG